MGFSYIGAVSGTNDATGTSLACSSTLNVAAHDVLVGWVSNETGDAGTLGVTDGTNAMSFESMSHDTHNWACFGLVLDATAVNPATFTFTNTTSRPYRNIGVMQFRPDVGDIIAKDQLNITGAGETPSLLSGNITTTGDDEIVIGAGKDYVTGTYSAWQIGDTNATGTVNISGFSGMWYRILTTTASNIHAQATAGYDFWICHIIAIKATAGGASVALSGTATSSITELDIVVGGKTVILTLSGDTWIA